MSVRNEYGDPTSIVFNDCELVFKTEFDEYYAVFCDEEFKKIVEENGLTGIDFDPDLANLFDRDAGTMKPVSH